MHADPLFRDPGRLLDRDLELTLRKLDQAAPARGYVPAYRFLMRADGKIAGAIDLRIGWTLELERYAGHIGYEVEPGFRGRHFAERACRLLLPLARAHSMPALWITCGPDNIASRRTCERLGAALAEIVALPADSDMYREGERLKCRYRIELRK